MIPESPLKCIGEKVRFLSCFINLPNVILMSVTSLSVSVTDVFGSEEKTWKIQTKVNIYKKHDLETFLRCYCKRSCTH